jgi:hypothetical protein
VNERFGMRVQVRDGVGWWRSLLAQVDKLSGTACVDALRVRGLPTLELDDLWNGWV